MIINVPSNSQSFLSSSVDQDDLMITNAPDHLYVVVNAGCADKDIAHLKDHLASFQKKGGNVSMEIISDKFSLIALQGKIIIKK